MVTTDQLRRTRVEARPGTRLPYGLLSAAAVVPIGDRHELNGVDWQPLSCGVGLTTGWCVPDFDTDEERTKEFTRPENLTAPAVTAYHAVECSVLGFPYDEAVARARAVLDVGEQAALEGWLWDEMTAAATDVSAGAGDGSVVGRLAELELALAGATGGVGVIHVPIVLASYLGASGAVERDGARLRTLAGHLVSIGAGYPGTSPAGDAPDPDEVWMMASGPVTVRQDEVQVVPASERDSVALATNDRRVVAERTSVVQHECGSFAVLVAKSCCPATVGS